MSATSSHPMIKAAAIGAGNRGIVYAQYATAHPDRLRFTAVVEPDRVRRETFAREFNIPADGQFESFDVFIRRGRLGDAAINTTMDHLHHQTTVPLIEAGYHVLLEKPIAGSETEVRDLIDRAAKRQRVVMICHVLRYAPFYKAIKQRISSGEIGQIVSMRTSELVSYHHMATSFVRGKWRREDTSNPMILAKCCHDTDLIAWMMSGVRLRRVSSFGSLEYYRPEHAPPGSTDRCVNGCQVERTCPFSARRIYVDAKMWQFYAFVDLEGRENVTDEMRIQSLAGDNPYGRCVWRCDNDVVDRQTVSVEFANGSVATHEMICTASRPCRKMHILGTLGEIEGTMEEGRFVVRHMNPSVDGGYDEKWIDLNVSADMHGGGDLELVKDFVSAIAGEPTSLATTRIEDSLTGHEIAFAAEAARTQRKVVEFDNS